MKLFLVGLDETWVKICYPIFDGAIRPNQRLTDEAGIPRFGHTYLYDGAERTFSSSNNIGVIYMLRN
jgi:DNA-directed RNA polymerase subunit beta